MMTTALHMSINNNMQLMICYAHPIGVSPAGLEAWEYHHHMTRLRVPAHF